VIVGIVIAVVVLAALVALATSLRIAREYQRLVVFRLGRVVGTKGPGVVFLNPVTDRTQLVDLREQFFEVPHQVAITKDNAAISIDFLIFYKVVDPRQSVVAVQDLKGAALNLAATALRSVVGGISLDDVLSKREEINAALRVRLDEVTERWGVKVTNVEVREVNPPPTVQEAMTRQMAAERARRALVTEAEGQKQAAVLAAEGERQAAITLAEGQQQATVLAAEGERQAARLRAQGLAGALTELETVARGLDERTLALQYLQTLQRVGESAGSTFVLPMELADLAAGVRRLLAGTGPLVPGPDRPEGAPVDDGTVQPAADSLA
jgi:regulator of protease activity HflC (stomatin/prohibitin superfamily)